MTSLYRILKQHENYDMQDDSRELFRELMESVGAANQEDTQDGGQPDPREETEENVSLWVEEILDAAKKRAEEMKEEARQEGYDQGVKEGYEAGAEKAIKEHKQQSDEEIAKLQERIARFVKEVESEKERLLEEYLDDLKNIALSIGEKIVQTSLKSSEEVIERMILVATEKLKKSAWAKIYIGRGQELMEVHGDADFLRSLSKLADNVKIIMMEQEEVGTCIVELPDEIIDISVGTQLENIKEILNNARL